MTSESEVKMAAEENHHGLADQPFMNEGKKKDSFVCNPISNKTYYQSINNAL